MGRFDGRDVVLDTGPGREVGYGRNRAARASLRRYVDAFIGRPGVGWLSDGLRQNREHEALAGLQRVQLVDDLQLAAEAMRVISSSAAMRSTSFAAQARFTRIISTMAEPELCW